MQPDHDTISWLRLASVSNIGVPHSLAKIRSEVEVIVGLLDVFRIIGLTPTPPTPQFTYASCRPPDLILFKTSTYHTKEEEKDKAEAVLKKRHYARLGGGQSKRIAG